jgi:predicted O-methyltransferase YrrM
MVTAFERKRQFYRFLRSKVGCLHFLHDLFWRVNRYILTSPVLSAAWKRCFERNRLSLPVITVVDLRLDIVDTILFPGVKQDGFDEDANLQDLIFLLQLSKARKASRILEVGTYRAKTTYAMHLNRPEAFICSYDVRKVDSDYRNILENTGNVRLQINSFAADADALRDQRPFDLIFIDGSHRLEDVLADSALAFEILSNEGIVVWHDYRKSGYWSPDLQVPEALSHLQERFVISAVKDTNCAVYIRG